MAFVFVLEEIEFGSLYFPEKNNFQISSLLRVHLIELRTERNI